ncbi:hypothetical protein [Acidovorax sp. Leaf78]|jgi:hypothetical protein|uniref:hypothetical protein n=1 Tax=Acidovorax sp. Leaf78 TaxID=1736237 RepID=UPI000A5D9F8E|nr:hypothetical protein [Acidovorax sp. Leaf78]RYH14844.1 MAG: hypothetical protein EON54_29045 [Alcaligenaceae bacterium]
MKKAIHIVPVLAAALAALMTATSAQAYISTGDETSVIHNNTNGCVRAYVGDHMIDVPPHSSSQFFGVGIDVYYLVSVFPTHFCGNHAQRSIWFGGGSVHWVVNP